MFVTDQGLHCYKVMPFRLKNTGATYQRLVNKFCEPFIERTVEVYVDDMIVKSMLVDEHGHDLRKTFEILRTFDMKLNRRSAYLVSGRGSSSAL